jgi:ABC-type Zn uptake system ZnuABC Zn-binding protein ZnuA
MVYANVMLGTLVMTVLSLSAQEIVTHQMVNVILLLESVNVKTIFQESYVNKRDVKMIVLGMESVTLAELVCVIIIM